MTAPGPRDHPRSHAFDDAGLPLIQPENFFTRVWHSGCNGPMRRHDDWMEIEDGSQIPRWECMSCGAQVHAGLDERRFVVRRAVPTGDAPGGET